MPDFELFDVIEFRNGYWPASKFDDLTNPRFVIRAGENLWPRADGRQEMIGGLGGPLTSGAIAGLRIFAADSQRAEILGSLIAGRLPYADLVRYANSALFFLSEQANQQVYLDEVAQSGVT